MGSAIYYLGARATKDYEKSLCRVKRKIEIEKDLSEYVTNDIKFLLGTIFHQRNCQSKTEMTLLLSKQNIPFL